MYGAGMLALTARTGSVVVVESYMIVEGSSEVGTDSANSLHKCTPSASRVWISASKGDSRELAGDSARRTRSVGALWGFACLRR